MVSKKAFNLVVVLLSISIIMTSGVNIYQTLQISDLRDHVRQLQEATITTQDAAIHLLEAHTKEAK